MARFWLKSAFAVVAASAGVAVAQPPAPVTPADGTVPRRTATAIPDVPTTFPGGVTPAGFQPDPTGGTAARQDTTPVTQPTPTTTDTGARSTTNEAASTGQVQVNSPANQSIKASDAGDLLSKSAES